MEEVDGNSLAILYSNFTRQLLQVACVQGDGQNLIHITKRLTTTLTASGTHPLRVSGEKEIPSARRTLISRPVFANLTSDVACAFIPANVITINALDTLGKVPFSSSVSHAAAKTSVGPTSVFRESPRA